VEMCPAGVVCGWQPWTRNLRSGTSIPSTVGTTTASGIDLASLRRDWQSPQRPIGWDPPPPLCVRGRPVLGSCRLISSAQLPLPIAFPDPHRRPHHLPSPQTFPSRSRPPVSVCGSSSRPRRLHPPPSPWRSSAARLRAWRGPARPPSRSARYVGWFGPERWGGPIDRVALQRGARVPRGSPWAMRGRCTARDHAAQSRWRFTRALGSGPVFAVDTLLTDPLVARSPPVNAFSCPALPAVFPQ